MDRGKVFRYESYVIDADTGLLTCRYSLDGRGFEECLTLSPGGCWESPGAAAAARLVFLLAGVSYYKTAAPPLIDLCGEPLSDLERSFLRDFYVEGLGEFACRNEIDLSDLRFECETAPAVPAITEDAVRAPSKVLVPFGGGIDSIVTVEHVRQRADVTLFVVQGPGDRLDGIEGSAAVAGLPVARAERKVDPQLLRSHELGFLHGHVPVTGIWSAVAVLAAVLEQHTAVIMSNEWSASIPTRHYRGRPINHQWSKSEAFEEAFRSVLAEQRVGLPGYFSALRDRTELWVAERFARLEAYHETFRSCNRSFRLDKARRLDHWCGQCDKCYFVDLILAPFMPASALQAVFRATREPLNAPELMPKFRALLGARTKPFDCVGEVSECCAAVLLAARRADRADCVLLQALAAEVASRPDAPTTPEIAALSHPVGRTLLPVDYTLEE